MNVNTKDAARNLHLFGCHHGAEVTESIWPVEEAGSALSTVWAKNISEPHLPHNSGTRLTERQTGWRVFNDDADWFQFAAM